MENNKTPLNQAKKGLETTLSDFQKGLNFAASNPIYLLPPILIDLIVWFGPRIGFHDVLREPLGNLFSASLVQLPTALKLQYTPIFRSILEGLRSSNLIGTIALLPGSIPFLFSGNLPGDAPGLEIQRIEVPNLAIFSLIFVFLTIFGFVFGIFYYSILTRRILEFKEKLSLRRFAAQIGRFAVILIFLVLVITAISIALSFALLIFLRMGQFVVSIFAAAVMIGLIWAILPFLFVPAGIFSDLTIRDAILVSRNIPVSDLIGNAKFWTITFVITIGLRNIWRIPESDSWMTLIGIFGSAFITVAIYAAYIYRYRSQLINTLKIRHFLSGIQLREGTNGKQSNN